MLNCIASGFTEPNVVESRQLVNLVHKSLALRCIGPLGDMPFETFKMVVSRVGLKSDGTTGQTTGHLAARGSASRYMACRKATRQATELTTV